MGRLDDVLARLLEDSRATYRGDPPAEVEPGTCPAMSDAEMSIMLAELGLRGPTMEEQVASCRRYGLRLVDSDGTVIYEPG